MEIVGKSLTTCQVDASGTACRLNLEAEDGTPASVVLPLDCLRSLLMTLPGMIERALKRRYRDNTLKLVYPTGDWSLEAAAGSDQTILTLATPDGFKVAFALTPEHVDRLAASLGDAEPAVPLSETVN
jgi:hypothetical protein